MKTFLVLNGPMCSGKSTITDLLMKRDGFFIASYDRIKWLISNYSADNVDHRRIAKEIVMSTISEAMNQGLSIVIDGGNHKYRDGYRKLAEEHGYKYVSVNIEAPYEVLKVRFLDRVASAKKIDRPHLSVTTLDGFDLRYKWYQDENRDMSATATLDSSILSINEIINEIDGHLSEK